MSSAAPMAESRVGHTATVLDDGRILIAGGASRDENPTPAEVFDPGTGTFIATNCSGTGTQHTATLLSDGRVLLAGGWGDSAALYDPTTRACPATGSMTAGRAAQTATLLLDGRVLVAGGTANPDWTAYLASAELYQP